MLFNSTVFLFLFLPVTYLVFWALPNKNQRYLWLTVTSYVFYGYWNWWYCYLMAFATVVSYLTGLGFLRWQNSPRARRLLLIVPIAIELGLLGYFKYTDFSIQMLNGLLSWQGLATLPLPQILLPIGISFYIFHTITYIVDCYLEVIKPTRNFLEFSCYVSLFSQLVAGPIVRFRELEKDLERIDLTSRRDFLDRGWSFFTIGLIQKVVIADSIAAVIDPAFQNVWSLSTASAWLCMLGYTYQIYFDFAGYSNMAVGLGLLFGLHIPQNFNSPYRAVNPADFWRRWHMTLSRCFRDYVYLPMIGRRPAERRIYLVTLVTMTLCGLWHGANYTFVLWGAYHGLLLVIYTRYAAFWDGWAPWLQRAVTFFLVLFGLVLFRAPDYATAKAIFARLLLPYDGAPLIGAGVLVVFLILAGAIAHFGPNTFEMPHQWRPLATASLCLLFVLSLFLIYGAKSSPFLYFQF
ncbi:MAG: MBOAT family protein [Deltaproteobacteria bacterium]|nr:MBOAT family protein [Deltaproteobacteria bacterium]